MEPLELLESGPLLTICKERIVGDALNGGESYLVFVRRSANQATHMLVREVGSASCRKEWFDTPLLFFFMFCLLIRRNKAIVDYKKLKNNNNKKRRRRRRD